MNLNELKNDWAELEATNPANSTDLAATLKQEPKRLRRLKLKLGVEAALLTLLFLVFHDWFDGHLRPLRLNILLGAALALGDRQQYRGLSHDRPAAGKLGSAGFPRALEPPVRRPGLARLDRDRRDQPPAHGLPDLERRPDPAQAGAGRHLDGVRLLRRLDDPPATGEPEAARPRTASTNWTPKRKQIERCGAYWLACSPVFGKSILELKQSHPCPLLQPVLYS